MCVCVLDNRAQEHKQEEVSCFVISFSLFPPFFFSLDP